MGNRIDDRYEYGRHIPLTCKNHPELRWSTKNIGNIGQRSIFAITNECACSLADLRPLTEEEHNALAKG